MKIEDIRKGLMDRFPEIAGDLKEASEAAVIMFNEVIKVPREKRFMVVAALGSMVENQENEKEAHKCI